MPHCYDGKYHNRAERVSSLAFEHIMCKQYLEKRTITSFALAPFLWKSQ